MYEKFASNTFELLIILLVILANDGVCFDSELDVTSLITAFMVTVDVFIGFVCTTIENYFFAKKLMPPLYNAQFAAHIIG